MTDFSVITDDRPEEQGWWRRGRQRLLARGGHPDRISQIYGFARISAACNVALAATLSALFWSELPAWSIILWFSVVVFQGAVSWVNQYRAHTLKITRISDRTLRRLSVMSMFIAVAWMPVPILTMLMLEGDAKAVAFSLIAVHISGAAVVFSVIPILLVIYNGAVLMPAVVLGLVMVPFPGKLLAVSMLVLFAVFLAFSIDFCRVIGLGERRSAQRLKALQDLQAAHSDIHKLAATDQMTQLLNRRVFLEVLEETLAGARRGGALNHALFLIDLDHFKHVNDAYGHDSGDMMLRAAAARLRDAVGSEGVVARLGGDEFAVMSKAAMPTQKITALGQRMLRALSQPVEIKAQTLSLGGTIGAALAPRDCDTVGEWLTFADESLREAKHIHRGTLRVFNGFDKDRMMELAELESLLEAAIRDDEIVPYYQPQMDARTGQLVGFEALARWIRPDNRAVGPQRFFELAERSGRVLDLSERIFRRVAEDYARARARGIDPGTISLNLHPNQLHHEERLTALLGYVATLVGDTTRITLEVTENCIIGRGTEHIPEFLRELSEMGYRISLDDYGTGYASLTHIKDMPIDELKIDRKFIMDVTRNEQDRVIVESIYRISRPDDISVVAEGVETPEQIERLRALGGNIFQGYYYARPMPAEEAWSFASGHRRLCGRAMSSPGDYRAM